MTESSVSGVSLGLGSGLWSSPGGDRQLGVYTITPGLAAIQLAVESFEKKAIARVTHPRPDLPTFPHWPN